MQETWFEIEFDFKILPLLQDLRMKARKHQEALGLLDHEWLLYIVRDIWKEAIALAV